MCSLLIFIGVALLYIIFLFNKKTKSKRQNSNNKTKVLKLKDLKAALQSAINTLEFVIYFLGFIHL